MIPNETIQTVATTGAGVNVVGNFDFDESTKARILQSLSDKIYNRKELAVVREYCNNANDAHIEAGKPTIEVQVTLPLLNDLTFRVRDFGSGLSRDDIRNVYCILGKSTKRNKPDQNGVLGYGCKAGFAHADSFTVTSWNNGEKAVYNCIKGDSQTLNSIIELSRCPSDEPTGIEICIPVKQTSLWTFHREASDFFKYWETLPTITNMDSGSTERMMKFRNTAPTLVGDGWNVRPRCDGTAVGAAYMGGVAYRIDWEVLYNRMALDSKKRVMFDLLKNNDVTLFFKMSEIQFVDSREGLEYTEITINALKARIEGIFSKIQESIQEKFDPAPNIWEAKMIYNAIFGTGIIEVESGESSDCVDKIKILDGNLMALENTFRGAFKWNGIVLDDPTFQDINRFDNIKTSDINDKNYTPSAPVMVTYRRKNKRAKVARCTGDKNSDIVASHQVAVVMNDTGKKSGQSVIARYLIFRENSKVRTVHVLTFADSTIKDNFFKTLNFDTVPTIKFSDILVEAKAWAAANKVSRSYGGGGGGARPMTYIDVETGRVEEVEVPIRDMEDGGIYVETGEGRRCSSRVRMGNTYSTEYPSHVAEHLKVLSKNGIVDLDRVYIINKLTRESKWFKQAVESGEWTILWDYLKENVDVDVQSLVDSYEFDSNNRVDEKAVTMLTPLITDKNSPMLKLIQIGSNGTKNEENVEIVESLTHLGLWDALKGDVKSTVDYETVSKVAHESYPYLSFNHIENGYYVNEEEMVKVARYVNAMDLYVDLTANTTAVEKTEEVLETA